MTLSTNVLPNRSTRMQWRGLLSTLGAFALLLAASAPAARAEPVSVSVDMTQLRTMASYHIEPGAPDDVYMVITGVVKGEEVNKRLPESGTWQAAPKQPAVQPDKKVTLWKGDLEEGEVALLTVTRLQGKGEDQAALTASFDAKAEAEKAVAERSKKTRTPPEYKSLYTKTLEAQQDLVKNRIKD